MTQPNLVETLRELHFLDDIEEEHLAQLAAIARGVEFPAGKIIFREGEPAQRFYLLVDGSVSLEICAAGFGCRRICTVTGGELLGWSPVFQHSKLTATARALAATRAIELDAGQVMALCEHDPRFGYEFLKRASLTLAQRLDAARLQLIDVYGSHLPQTAESAAHYRDGT